MKRSIVSAFLLLALCTQAMAGGTLVLTHAGYQVMTVGPNGAVLSPVTPVDQVVDLRTGAPPPTTPPGTDPPSNPSSLTTKVEQWARAVNDPNGAAVLSQSYRLIGEQIQSGAIPADTASVDKALSQFLDSTLGMLPGSKEKWAGFRGKVAQELAARVIASGGDLTAAEYAAFFNEVHGGLAASHSDTALPVWLAQIIAALLPILLQLITDLFGGAG